MKFITSDHVRLDYEDEGSGYPILLVSGLGMCKEIWRPTKEFLLQNGYRVVTFDARNQGASEHTFKGARISRHAIDVYELLQSLSIEHCLAVGHSMGASTMFGYVSLFGRGQLDGLIDIDQSPKMINDETWHYGFKDLSWDEFPAALKMPLGRATAVEIDAVTVAAVRQANAQHPYDESANLNFAIDHAFQDWRDIVALMPVPFLAVAGEKSPYFNSDFLQAIKILNEKAQTAKIANAGHAVMAEQPVEFNAVLGDFVKKIAP
ncbi:alpha/beta fold hydrolase [Limosilactobacillus mucosae]|uniref:alpha/beta fold hydrolase n=1 Tax=Limosilactobacillus mucosae TaxID=97478 RepID=UPI0040399196